MTASVLLKLASVFDADLQQFSAEDATAWWHSSGMC